MVGAATTGGASRGQGGGRSEDDADESCEYILTMLSFPDCRMMDMVYN